MAFFCFFQITIENCFTIHSYCRCSIFLQRKLTKERYTFHAPGEYRDQFYKYRF